MCHIRRTIGPAMADGMPIPGATMAVWGMIDDPGVFPTHPRIGRPGGPTPDADHHPCNAGESLME